MLAPPVTLSMIGQARPGWSRGQGWGRTGFGWPGVALRRQPERAGVSPRGARGAVWETEENPVEPLPWEWGGGGWKGGARRRFRDGTRCAPSSGARGGGAG